MRIKPHGFPSHSLMDPPAQINQYETATATLSLPATPPQTHGSDLVLQTRFALNLVELNCGLDVRSPDTLQGGKVLPFPDSRPVRCWW